LNKTKEQDIFLIVSTNKRIKFLIHTVRFSSFTFLPKL